MQEAADGIFYFAGCIQHYIFVIGQQLLEAGILYAHLVFQSSVIKDFPLEGGTGRKGEIIRVEQVTEVIITGIIHIPADRTQQSKTG